MLIRHLKKQEDGSAMRVVAKEIRRWLNPFLY